VKFLIRLQIPVPQDPCRDLGNMEAGGDPFKVRFFVIDDPLGQNMRFLSSAPARAGRKMQIYAAGQKPVFKRQESAEQPMVKQTGGYSRIPLPGN